MNRKGPWEGYRRQAKLARCLLPAAFLCAYIKERRLGTRQTKYNEVFRGGEGGGGGALYIFLENTRNLFVVLESKGLYYRHRYHHFFLYFRGVPGSVPGCPTLQKF